MIQVCLLLKMSIWSLHAAGLDRDAAQQGPGEDDADDDERHPDVAGVLVPDLLVDALLRVRRSAARRRRGRSPTIHGVTNCTTLTPKLPMPACTPSAVPCLALGKKYDVLGMKPENTPPPMPARTARSSRTAYGVSGFCTARPQPISGMRNSAVVIVRRACGCP